MLQNIIQNRIWVYALGYSARMPHQLRALAEHLDAVVAGIRFS
jgi:hypothetical protein